MTLLRIVSALALALAGLAASAATAGAAERISYEVGSQGDVATDVGAFGAHVSSTLDDPRGWSLGGSIEFVPVEQDGALRILIAEPAEIGAIAGCSAQYSCHVSGTVYINEERWNEGAAGWSESLDRYRHYVVNHEVGHYLELDHVDCPGAGEPGPVMMQQTIETEPCRNRVWPLPDERRIVADRYGVPVLDAAYADELAFVRGAYDRLLGRSPAGDVARAWAEQLDAADLTRAQLVDAIFASDELDAVTASIARSYFAAFARPPEPAGLVHWMGRMQQDGLSLTDVADRFVGSDEFRQRYGDPDAEDYVELLYENVLGRSSDPAGKEDWVEALQSGRLSRAEVLIGFANSPEHRDRRGELVTVSILYDALLGRLGDPSGIEHWVDRLRSGTPRVEVIRAFLRSGESVI